MHMGELRSNLYGYRHLAQDQENGDMIASAEADRVAANQLNEIKNRFAGKKAQAAAATIVAQLKQQSDNKWMEVFNRNMYERPQAKNQVVDTKERAAGAQTYNPAANYMPPSSPEAPQTAKPVPADNGQGMATRWGLGGVGAAAPGVTPGVIAKATAAAGGKSPEQVSEALARIRGTQQRTAEAEKNKPSAAGERMPGADEAADFTNRSITEELKSQGLDPSDYKAWNKGVKELETQDKEDLAELGKNSKLGEQVGSYHAATSILRQINIIKAKSAALGEDPNTILGDLRQFTGSKAAARINDLKNRYFPPNTPADKERWELVRASENFHQKVSLGINDYFHSLGGANLTEAEMKRFQESIDSKDSLPRIEGFFRDHAENKAGIVRAITSGVKSQRAAYRYLLNNGINPAGVNVGGVRK
jgi:hypothetical protein